MGERGVPGVREILEGIDEGFASEELPGRRPRSESALFITTCCKSSNKKNQAHEALDSRSKINSGMLGENVRFESLKLLRLKTRAPSTGVRSNSFLSFWTSMCVV